MRRALTSASTLMRERLSADPVKVKVVERASNRIIENNVEDLGCVSFSTSRIQIFNYFIRRILYLKRIELVWNDKNKKKIVDLTCWIVVEVEVESKEKWNKKK